VIEGIAPYQSAVEPYLSFFAAAGHFTMERPKIVIISKSGESEWWFTNPAHLAMNRIDVKSISTGNL
jgi:hypothetical protein